MYYVYFIIQFILENLLQPSSII